MSSAWFGPGWIIGAALGFLVFEALVVGFRERFRLSKTAHIGWLASLAAGAGLLGAVWAALVFGQSAYLLLALLVAFCGHVGDMTCRIREARSR